MSFAFMPIYTGDYLRDTRHLTPMRHGVYLLLLMHCWDQKGPLPLDEQECAGIANCRSADEIEAIRYVLNKYFIRMDDGWYNLRMQAEVERSEAISRARSDAGKRGYEAKAKQLLSISQTNASTPTPTPTTTPTKNIIRANALIGFNDFWLAYPKKKNKGQAEKAWKSLKVTEITLPAIMDGLAQAKLHDNRFAGDGSYIPYPATWLNARGWEDEQSSAHIFDYNLLKD